jgi:hypothetical protein
VAGEHNEALGASRWPVPERRGEIDFAGQRADLPFDRDGQGAEYGYVDQHDWVTPRYNLEFATSNRSVAISLPGRLARCPTKDSCCWFVTQGWKTILHACYFDLNLASWS